MSNNFKNSLKSPGSLVTIGDLALHLNGGEPLIPAGGSPEGLVGSGRALMIGDGECVAVECALHDAQAGFVGGLMRTIL